MTSSPTGRVTPFGHLRITRCLLLPAAFRSLPRPSSPDSSKASSVDPYSLDHITHCPFSFNSHPVTSLVRYSNNGKITCQRTIHPCELSSARQRNQNQQKLNINISKKAMEVRGLEPLTYGLQSHRSSQLSYTPGTYRPLLHAATEGLTRCNSRTRPEDFPAKLTSYVQTAAIRITKSRRMLLQK